MATDDETREALLRIEREGTPDDLRAAVNTITANLVAGRQQPPDATSDAVPAEQPAPDPAPPEPAPAAQNGTGDADVQQLLVQLAERLQQAPAPPADPDADPAIYRSFEMFGHTYRVRHSLPAWPMIKLAEAEQAGDDMGALAWFATLLRRTVHPDDYGRLDEHMSESNVGLPEMQDVFAALAMGAGAVQAEGQRPT